MEAKGADLVVVNDVGREGIGFDAPENEVLILTARGDRQAISRRGKRGVAEKIWDAFLLARGPQGRDGDVSASTVHLSDAQPK